MLHAIINWFGVLHDEDMPADLKLGRLDRMDGLNTRHTA